MNRHEYKTLGKFIGAAPVLTANASPVNHHRAMSEELKAAYQRIEELEKTLKHADEALFWHKGEAFEMDGKTIGEAIADVLS